MALATKENKSKRLNNIVIEVNGKIVGGAESLSYSFSRSDEFLRQAGGGSLPYAIDQGDAEVTGSIEQIWLNDDAFEGIDYDTGQSPYLDFVGTATVDNSTFRIKDAVIYELSKDMAIGSKTTISKSFNALKVVPV